MKKFFVLIPFLLYSQTLQEIKNSIENSFNYQIAKEKIKLIKNNLEIAKSYKKGILNFNYEAIRFIDRPYSKIDLGTKIDVYNTNKYHYSTQLQYSFPIYNKVLDNSIEKSKIELLKEKLKLENTKRILLLEVLEIYSNIYAVNQNIKAFEVAKKSLSISKDKAKAFYEDGLLNKSNFDEISAKYYEILSHLEELKSQKKILLNNLSYLLNTKIQNIQPITIKKESFSHNFENRVDVKIIKTDLDIASEDIKISNASNYPTLDFQIGIKKEADNLILNKNKYSNIDTNYLALSLKYSFDFSKTYTNQNSKIAKNINYLFYKNYLLKIKTEFQSDLDKLTALFIELNSAKQEIIARQSYYNYIQDKFNEGLSDSSDLNDAIAKLALSKAKRDLIKSKIFFLQEKLKLNSGK